MNKDNLEDVGISIIFGVVMIILLSISAAIASWIISSWIGKIIIGGLLSMWYYNTLPEMPKKK